MNNFKIFTLTSQEKENIIYIIKEELQKKEEIIFAYIFGSFVDPEMTFFRDIDLGIYIGKDIILEEQFIDYSMNLSLIIEGVIKKYPVDVIILNNAPLSLSYRIIQSKLLFCKNEDFWVDFITKTLLMYHDHAISSRYILEDLLTA